MDITNSYAAGSPMFHKCPKIAPQIRFPDGRRPTALKIDAEDKPRLVTFEVDEIERRA